jgi:hypothetical protein
MDHANRITRKRHAAEFPVRDWCWRKEIGEGERVACTRISLNNIQINNKDGLDYRGMIPKGD